MRNKFYLYQVIFLSVLILAGQKLKAQNSISRYDIFGMVPRNIPAPAWAYKINWQQFNINQVQRVLDKYKDSIAAYRVNEEGLIVNHEKKYLAERSKGEEPYELAWRLFLRKIQPFITPGDSIFTFSNELIAQKAKDAIANSPQRLQGTNGTALVEAANWTALGPKNSFMTNGERDEHTNIYRLAIAPSNTNVLYCGSETGAIFKTTNKGLNWQMINGGISGGMTSTAMAVLPSDENLLFAAANNILYKYTGGTGVWSATSLPAATMAQRLLFSPSSTASSSVLLAACEDGQIYRSTNLGASFTTASGAGYGKNVWDMALKPNDANIVYAVTSNSANKLVMLRSTNGGVSFISMPAPDIVCTAARMTVSPQNPDIVYSVVLTDTDSKILKSTDAGLSWSIVSTQFCSNWTGCGTTNGMGTGQGYYDLVIYANPLNANDVLVGTSSLYKSVDGGVNFNPLAGYAGGTHTIHVDYQSITGTNTETYITTDGGVVRSTDFYINPANMTYRLNGLTAVDYWGFDQGWGEDIIVGGRYHNGNAGLYDGWGAGNSVAIGGGESPTGHVFTAPSKSLNAAFDDMGGGVIFPSTLTGSPVYGAFANSVWPNTDWYGLFNSRLVIHPNYSNIVYVGKGNQLWKSTNRGASYSVLRDFGAKVWRFDVNRSNPNYIYLIAENGVYRTTDGGANWANITPAFQLSNMANMYYNSDIVSDPFNPSIVWVSFPRATFFAIFGIPVSTDHKVYKSTDGGSGWTGYGANLNSTSSTTNPVAYLQAQGGTNGGIYAITNSIPSKVYYRDNNMSNWQDYSNGLPNNFFAKIGGKIFYRDEKLRLCGSLGVWESPLAASSTPQAMPMTTSDTILCARDTVRFTDYSILKYAGASWQWSFPGATYVSSTTAREPKVVFGSAGSFNVTLTVTNTSGQSHTTTKNNMIHVKGTCGVDTIPGRALYVNGTGNYAVTQDVSIAASNRVTLSAWVKLPSVQPSWSAILSSADAGYELLMRPGNQIGFHWNGSPWEWTWGGGPILPVNKWTHVALVITPTSGTLYVNGVPYTQTGTCTSNSFSQQFFIGTDRGINDRCMTALIEEVCIYDRSLSTTEVRELMNLTRNFGTVDAGLKVYYQFNEASGQIIDRVGFAHADMLGTSSRQPSTVPVGSGKAQTISVTSGGTKNFNNTGLQLTFPASGTYPNGDLVVTRINLPPDQLATAPTLPSPNAQYWIVRNYGTNATFSSLTGMQFTGVRGAQAGNVVATPSIVKLFKRGSNDDGATWGSAIDGADAVTNVTGTGADISFTTGLTNTSFSQYTMGTLGVALPVRLISFTGVKQGAVSVLSWQVADEVNFSHYELERSGDGQSFAVIGNIAATGSSQYSYTDNQPLAGTNYYRLVMVDKDGIKRYSNVVVLEFLQPLEFVMRPVPAGDKLTLQANQALPEAMNVLLRTTGGQLLQQHTATRGSRSVELNLDRYNRGMYIVTVYNSGGEVVFKQMFSKL